jgi:signal transduction histidine kinase
MLMPKVRVKPEWVESSMLSSMHRGKQAVGQDAPPLLVFDESRVGSPELAYLLEGRGYRVVTAGSCGEAIEMIRDTRPALAVVAPGSTGPAGSGCRLADLRLAARELGIPVLDVVEAGVDLSETIEESADSEDWVVRGSTPEELDARVARLIRRAGQAASSAPAKGSPIDPQFSSLVVHDLRTPLNVIVLSLNMIEHSLPNHDPDVDEAIRFIKENYRQIEQMVSQLSDYARLFENGPPLSVSDFDPRRLVGALIENRRSRPWMRTSPVQLDIQETCPTEATLDQLRARMAIEYALNNADAAAQGEPIRLRLRGGPQRWIIEVAIDQPPPASVTSHTLEPQAFERLCGSAVERRGMDLAIAARISEMFGGTARFDAVEGLGTTIILDWPSRIPDGSSTR